LSSAGAEDSAPSIERSTEALAAHSGFQFRPVASEPLVIDPISARLDAKGRLWVVEMPDYPNGPPDGGEPRGRIKILEDRDGDGVFDHANLFAQGLEFVTGVQPYRDGAIVTLAGQIAFIRDLDGDGRGDETQVLFRGFAEQNQQLRANHPTLGPDGLVYVANGLRGGAVVAVDSRYEPRPSPLDLRDRDFAFDPEGGWWGAVAGTSQFGMTIDDFGRRIGCSNRNPAKTAPLSLDAIERDPLYAARDAIVDVAAAADQSKVVSRAEAWTTSNLHSGQFSAACGVFAPGLEDAGGEWILVCEPTAYLVQKQRIRRDGSVWVAQRAEQADEFFASANTWFRPVDVAAGPGTSVYVVDMARAVIEHPDFMPEELKSRPDQRDGDDLGRIWQIAPGGDWPVTRTLESAQQALRWLQSRSPWQRQMASQFLLEVSDDHESGLTAIVLSPDSLPQARSRAAWLLQRRQRIELDHLSALMQSDDGRLRALAAELASRDEGGLPIVTRLCHDADPLVRRVAAAVVGGSADAIEDRAEALAAAVTAGESDRWIERTVASSNSALIGPLAQRMAQRGDVQADLLAHLIERLAIESPDQASGIVELLLERRGWRAPLDEHSVTAMEAWINGNRKGRRSPSRALEVIPSGARERIQSAYESAGETAADTAVSPALRARCLEVAVAAGVVPQDLRRLFSSESPRALRAAALKPLLQVDRDWMRAYLEEHLTGMSIALREAAMDACGSNPSDANWLLDRVAAGSIPKTIIDPALAKRLRQHPDATVAAKAEKLLRSDPDRARVLSEYKVASQDLGDADVGRRLFTEHCSACHHIDGVGTNVGPDISDTRTKTAESLLVSILDPNAAIDSSFVQYQILTVDGRVLDGLLIDETADSVTLQQKGGERITIAREEMDQIKSPGVSLMPEGFERSLDQKAMSHLLSYLKNWRYLKTSIPGTLPE
jgi:putative membrane-bound dehydrogenase-like protein